MNLSILGMYCKVLFGNLFERAVIVFNLDLHVFRDRERHVGFFQLAPHFFHVSILRANYGPVEHSVEYMNGSSLR